MPQYASICGLSPPIKYRIIFYYTTKKHPYTCVCAVFVVSLCPNFKINNPANGSQDERSPGKEKARK